MHFLSLAFCVISCTESIYDKRFGEDVADTSVSFPKDKPGKNKRIFRAVIDELTWHCKHNERVLKAKNLTESYNAYTSSNLPQISIDQYLQRWTVIYPHSCVFLNVFWFQHPFQNELLQNEQKQTESRDTQHSAMKYLHLHSSTSLDCAPPNRVPSGGSHGSQYTDSPLSLFSWHTKCVKLNWGPSNWVSTQRLWELTILVWEYLKFPCFIVISNVGYIWCTFRYRIFTWFFVAWIFLRTTLLGSKFFVRDPL